MAGAATALLAALAGAAVGDLPTWSWATLQTFVHCSNRSGPLNDDIVQLMANSSFAVIEKYQCLECVPNHTEAEAKVLVAANQIRHVDPRAAVMFYFAVDYTRTWYDLGAWFEAHPELEVHNADDSLATVTSNDNGDNQWHVLDFAQADALNKWAADVVSVVRTGNLDGVFIDGYRDPSKWTQQLIPHANASEAASWLDAAWNRTGKALEFAFSWYPETIRIPNGNPQMTPPPGYNAISIEFFGVGQIELLQGLAKNKTFVEVHSYIGDNRALFNVTLAAYLVAFGENAYFGAGNTWDTCESWLVGYQIAEYSKPLGEPQGVAAVTAVRTETGRAATQYTRNFATGTHVKLTVPSGDGDGGSGDGVSGAPPPAQSCVWWSDGTATGNACVADAGTAA